MNSGRTIFAQRMDLLPLPEFRRCVERYQGDYKVQSFSSLDQFLSLAFAQMKFPNRSLFPTGSVHLMMGQY